MRQPASRLAHHFRLLRPPSAKKPPPDMASYAKDPEDDSAPDLEAPNVTALDLAKTILAGLDANDLASFDASVAPDVKLYALTEKKESSGKDSTLQKMGEISSKLKGKLGSQEFAQLASDERVRALVVASMMGMKIRLGFEFTVRRGVLVEVGIGKGVPDDFMDVAAEGEDSGDDVELQPPYLVARPDVFPPPAVEARVLYVTPQLHSPYAIGARPLNPFVRIQVVDEKSKEKRCVAQTAERKNTKTPTWDETLLLTGADVGCALLITVIDHNRVGPNTWLGKATVAVAALAPGTKKLLDVPLEIRNKITHIREGDVNPAQKANLTIEFTAHDMQRWWTDAELRKRDDHADEPQRKWFHLW